MSHKTMILSIRAGLVLATVGGALGCGEREAIWDAHIDGNVVARGLTNGAAIIDAPANRVLMLPVNGDKTLAPSSLPIGKSFAAAETTVDGSMLMVLSLGVVPRRTAEDEGPSLTVIADTKLSEIHRRYELSDPLSGIAIDPESEFAVVFAGSGDTSFVQNPNELIFVELASKPGPNNPFPKTLRSFGGRPQALTFTPELGVPGGDRRLLVVQTDRDVALVDLDDLTRPEITIQLTGGDDILVPSGIAVSDGDLDRDDDTRIAIQVQGDPNVIVVDLLPLAEGEESPQTFRAAPNVVHVGGNPSDISFVETDGGLRLAALVPARQTLTLVDPATGIASEIDLGAPFEQLSLITNIVGATDEGSDVALLWSSSSSKIAFVALGSTVGTPYKSVDLLDLDEPVGEVHDVPSPNEHLKLLRSTNGYRLMVLDLIKRTASPISATSAAAITIAPTGTRAWISGGSDIAQLDLGSLHPLNLKLSHGIHSIFDVKRGDGGRALIALHAGGALGATVLDADNPSLADSSEYVGLLLGGL
jgi:hypothetical protein